MQNTHALFIGFPTFEEFLAASPRKKIYLTKHISTKPGEMGTQEREWQLTAAAPGDGVVHYWRMRIGSYQVIGGFPLDPAEENFEKDCDEVTTSGQDLLTAIAREDYGCSVIRGLASFPKDLVLLSGRTRLMKINREEKRYERISAEIKTAEAEQPIAA